MKRVLRKSLLTIFCSIFAVCGLCLAATAVSNKVPVNADAAALEAEFTNDGEFTVSKAAWNNSYSFIDGTSLGGTGAVLQAGTSAGVAGVRINFSPSNLAAGDVASIVVKVKAANFVKGTDEFRTTSNNGSTWRQYGKNDDLTDWFNYTLNANSMADMVQSDGTYGAVDICIRASSGNSITLYIDSITVNLRDTSGYETQTFGGVFNSASYNSLTRALLTYSGTATWNDSDDGNFKYKVMLKDSTGALSTDILANVSGVTLAHWAGQKWINIGLPGTYDTIIIPQGVNFAGVNIPAGTLTWNTSTSKWDWDSLLKETTFTQISWVNNYNSVWLAVTFNTSLWEQDGVPTSYSGIYYNGNDITDLATTVKYYLTSSVWFVYNNQATNPKLAAGYNGYTHPTIEFAEGATMEYGGHIFVFHAVKFYFNFDTSKWQTEVPDGYSDHVVEPELATFAGVWGNADGYNSSTTLLLRYTSTSDWDSTDKGTIASKITYRNSSTSATFSPTDSNIAGWSGQKWIILSGLSGYDVIEIAEDGTFGGAIEIPAGTFYLVNGRWVNTAPHAANTSYTAIADGWNNRLSAGSSCNVLRFDVNPLGAAASATNLAATLNRTSLMVKYNGSTFFELYSDTNNENRTKYKIDYEHGNGFFYFTVPEADLVDGATFEIEAGTPFMNYYLGEVTLVYNASSGQWQLPVNYNPSFVSINGSFNNESHGYFIAQFNTTGWAQDGVPTSYSGITYNGNNITDLATTVKFYQEHSVWFVYAPQASNPKLVANYNGYSHPTIAFAEGATMVYGGNTYTFHAVTFYLNLSTNKWQTEVPAGYYDHIDTAVFSGVWGSADGYNSSTSLLLQYTTTGAWDYTNKGTLASHITYRNSSTSASYSATDSNITGWDGQKWIILSGLSGYDVIEIAAGGMFGGAIEIPAGTFYLVNGRWVNTASHASNTVFTTIHATWNNYAAGNSTSGTILTYSVNPLGDAANSTNLAATPNRTSLMVKYNGETFFDLYSDTSNANRAKYSISYAHGNGFFYFTVPEADLVDGATLEVEDGTPFMNYYLEGVTITYNATSGKWQVPVNYNPSFVSINGSFNNESHGYFIAQFNTTGWAQDGVPTSYSGITYNGNNITDLATTVKFYQEHSVWFVYAPQASNPKLVANYNGYSHPTIAFAEGATMVYGGNTYTFHAVTFYLNLSTNKWQTAVPDGYAVRSVLTYSSVKASYNNNQTLASGYSCTLIQFSGTIGSYTGTNLASTLGANVSVGGATLNNISGAVLQIGYNGSYTNCLFVKVPVSALVIDQVSHAVKLVMTNSVLGDVVLNGITLYIVDDEWTTAPPPEEEKGTPDCDYTGITFWNNDDGKTILQFRNFVNLPDSMYSCKNSTGYYITYNGTRLSAIPNADVHTWEDQYWVYITLPNPTEGSILVIEEGAPFAGNYLPRLVFKLVGGIWCKGFTVTIDIDSDIYTYYSKDDVPIVINDAFFEELLSDRGIPAKLVSFSTRDVTYKAGTTFKVLTDTYITVKTIGFNTSEGAAVRLNSPTGIRYETKINKADYDALIATYGAGNIETGTYIVPRSLIDGTDFRTYFADNTKINGVDYVKIVNSGFYNRDTAASDGFYKYYGSLVNINPDNYTTEFFGIGYIKITNGLNVYVVFGGYDMDDYTRSIYYVSSRAYPDYDNETPQKTALKGYLDGVVYIDDDVVISSIIDIDGYSSPYTVTYNSVTGVYTVSGNSEIKSVMIGDKKKMNSRTSTIEVSGDTYYVTDYSLTASAVSSTLTFKLSSVYDALSLVDFTIEVPSNRGVKILQLTDTELIDSTQMRTSGDLTPAKQEEYARKCVYANCFNYISELVKNDRPDLIIVTGDIVDGNFDDNGTMWLKLIEFMDSFDIPWAPVFGTLENESAKGAVWQRAQLLSAENCLFAAGSVTGNGDYTIGITDGGVLRRVIYMLDSSTNNGISGAQVDWVKDISSDISSYYNTIPAFICYNKDSVNDYSTDFATARIDGVFKGNTPNDNSSALQGGIYYTYGTKTGTYGTYNSSKLGGTYITVAANGATFTVTPLCLDKTEMQNKVSIDLIESYDGSSIVTDAYLAPIWDTDRIYDETGLFVGETGSVTLMYTPTDPTKVVVRDITLGVTYTYGIDYTVSGNKVTRVAGGNLPYMSYDEYYRSTPVYVSGNPQGFTVTPVNGKGEDGYPIVGTKYLFYSEGFAGAAYHVTFTYDKTEAWTGTNFAGDSNSQTFINKLKSDKEATVFFYGDSITVGCNASGTEYGGFRNPNLPAWNDLVTDYLESLYGANITKYNGARGGWQTYEGAENLSTKVSECGTNLTDIDLLVIAFGINDIDKKVSSYITHMETMIDAYLAANPSGSVLLVSPMRPNTQSDMIAGNGQQCEDALLTIRNKAKYSGNNIAVAKVTTMFTELMTVSGKLARDYLGNNVNHPNDFGVRLYAQVILKSLCGDDFG